MANINKTINFLFSCNAEYLMPLNVSIVSIFENHKYNYINIYILHSNLSDKQKENLISLSHEYKQHIHMIEVEEKYYSKAPSLRWSKETYYRLLINELLPKNIDRIIYLDCDIVINNSVEELYSIELVDYYIAALPLKYSHKLRNRIGLRNEGLYFQAGVLLFNLDKCRSVISYEKTLEVINKLGFNMTAVDQDIINVMFDGKIKSIEKKFNNVEITNFYENNFYRLFNYTNKKNIKNTYIFHYATGKPWNNLFSGACENIWYKYLKLSPYKNLYYNKFKKLKYIILRLGLVKYLLYLYIHVTPIIEIFFRKILSENKYKNFKSFYRRNIK